MPRADFGNVDDAQSFDPLPAGRYTMVVERAVDGASRAGNDMTTLTLSVAACDDASLEGRRVWDRLTWSPKAMPRVKAFLAAAGFDVSGVVEVGAHDLIGCVVDVDVEEDGYKDDSGKWVRTNSVPFAGYHMPSREVDKEVVDGAMQSYENWRKGEAQPADDDDIPF